MLYAVIVVGVLVTNVATANSQKYEDFISDLGNDVISILVNKDKPLSIRKENFRKELHEHFDLKKIGRFVLARHWRRMNDDQKQQYLKLFEDAVIENYASQFDNYSNEKLLIQSSRKTADKGMVVKSKIIRQGKGAPLEIQWKIFNTKRGIKVLDVVVNNVSMSLTLRNEYNSVIQNEGGVPGLLNYLRGKIKRDQSKSV